MAKVCGSGLEKAELEEGSLDCSLSGTTATMAFVKKSVLYLGEVLTDFKIDFIMYFSTVAVFPR